MAQRMLALFRVSTTRSVGEPWFLELIAELSTHSPEFWGRWPRHDIASSPREAKTMNHPLVGQLFLHPNPLQVAHAPDSWLLVYTPLAQSDTHARLERLLTLPR